MSHLRLLIQVHGMVKGRKRYVKSMTLNRIQYRKRIHMANPDWLMMTISLLQFSWMKAYS